MKSSSDRILTTHTGSLPRSKALSALLVKREQHKTYDAGALQAEIERNLDLVVKRQQECGVDVGNDGETPQSRIFNVHDRTHERFRGRIAP